MTIREAAAAGITRLTYVENGKPVWNPYSFGDLTVFEDGTMGPWLLVYDPCGMLACGELAWTPIPHLAFPPHFNPAAQFEAYVPPEDMDRFPGCPPVPEVRSVGPSVK